MPSPPETKRDPVTENLHGETITDSYRWLEDDDEAVQAWEREQNAYTDGIVETDRRDALRSPMETVAQRTTYHLPTARGGRYFQRIEPANADHPRLTIRDERDGDPRVLVDPENLGETTSLEWFVPSPDGELVVYGLMEGGTEEYDLRVMDVDAGEIVDRIDGVGRCSPSAVEWVERDAGTVRGFYYLTTGAAGDADFLDKELRFREVDGEDRPITDAIPDRRWPGIQVDRETGTVVVTVGELGADADLYALIDGELVPVVTDVDAAFAPLAHAGRVYLQTNHEAPRFRLLGIDADAFPDADGLDAFEEVVRENEDVLANLAPAGAGVALHRIRDARSAVSLHEADGTERHELSLPEYVGIPRYAFDGSADAEEVLFTVKGFDRPAGIVHADASAGAGPDGWDVVQSPPLPDGLDPRDDLSLTVERLWVDSTDGADVPVYVVHREDVEPGGDAPTVLYGYGGFRIPQLPHLDPYRLPFIRDGGVFALACLRGGLEFGEEWHEQGSREHKHHTFDDFEAAAEALIDRGYTSEDRLAAWGGSNGGLTVGAALTGRPELFGAVVCGVPLLDMLRFHRFLLGETWTAEYGHPEEPEAFEWLRSYSPYHNVEERAYPATLFATAAGDTRVHPAHARKMAARVQAATTVDDPICYRSYDRAGHGSGTPTSLEVEQQLDRWTFVYEALDVDPGGPDGRRLRDGD